MQLDVYGSTTVQTSTDCERMCKQVARACLEGCPTVSPRLVGQAAHASSAAAEVHDSDRIHMRGLTFYGHHGVLPEVGAGSSLSLKWALTGSSSLQFGRQLRLQKA